MATIEQNQEKVLLLLNSVKREGMQNLIDWLKTTDYFTAPAAQSHHSNFEGGLISHCLKVYKVFKDNCERHKTKINLSEESIIIISLLHDLCKVNFYKPIKKMAKSESSNNQWVYIPAYEIEEEFPYGHGEKSVDIIRDFIKLTDEEKLCIRWHMGPYEGEIKWRDFGNACDKYDSVYLFHVSDNISSKFYEKEIERESLIKMAFGRGDFVNKR